MMDANAASVVVAENGTVIEAGGVYLTFSGDYERQYAVAKVISIGGWDGAGIIGSNLPPSARPKRRPAMSSNSVAVDRQTSSRCDVLTQPH